MNVARLTAMTVALVALLAMPLAGFLVGRMAEAPPLPVTAVEVAGAYADVTAYGAVGDGRHDDTDAFEAALATGRPVLVPRPEVQFIVSRPLQLTYGQALVGVGMRASAILCRVKGPCITNDPDYPEKLRGLTVRDLWLIGTGDPATDGIAFQRTNDAIIEHVAIENIGGIAVAIDGGEQNGIDQAHYAYIAGLDIRGPNRIGLQFRGTEKNQGSNRHRIFFCHINGSTDVAIDIQSRASTIGFYGIAVENVQSIARIAGRNNMFFGLNAETVHGPGITFLPGAWGNRFYAPRLGKVDGPLWVGLENNPPTRPGGVEDEDGTIEDNEAGAPLY